MTKYYPNVLPETMILKSFEDRTVPHHIKTPFLKTLLIPLSSSKSALKNLPSLWVRYIATPLAVCQKHSCSRRTVLNLGCCQ